MGGILKRTLPVFVGIKFWWFDVSKQIVFRQDPVWCTCTETALLDWRPQFADKMQKEKR